MLEYAPSDPQKESKALVTSQMGAAGEELGERGGQMPMSDASAHFRF